MRAICDEFGILLVADEVICGFGRLGEWFGSIRYDIRPDLVTFAKGIASAHVPLGGVLMTDRVAAPFLEGTTVLNHGITCGGHPVAAAVALKNLELMEREDVLGNVRRNEPYFRSCWTSWPRSPSSATSAAPALPLPGAGQGQGLQADVRRGGVGVPAAGFLWGGCSTPG